MFENALLQKCYEMRRLHFYIVVYLSHLYSYLIDGGLRYAI